MVADKLFPIINFTRDKVSGLDHLGPECWLSMNNASIIGMHSWSPQLSYNMKSLYSSHATFSAK